MCWVLALVSAASSRALARARAARQPAADPCAVVLAPLGATCSLRRRFELAAPGCERKWRAAADRAGSIRTRGGLEPHLEESNPLNDSPQRLNVADISATGHHIRANKMPMHVTGDGARAV